MVASNDIPRLAERLIGVDLLKGRLPLRIVDATVKKQLLGIPEDDSNEERPRDSDVVEVVANRKDEARVLLHQFLRHGVRVSDRKSPT